MSIASADCSRNLKNSVGPSSQKVGKKSDLVARLKETRLFKVRYHYSKPGPCGYSLTVSRTLRLCRPASVQWKVQGGSPEGSLQVAYASLDQMLRKTVVYVTDRCSAGMVSSGG